MPCDCPDEPPRPTPTGGCNYLCHSGGPTSNIYSLVAAAIPDLEMVHGRPTVHPDGSLEFPSLPPPILGYRHEGNRLYPAWPPCAPRMLRIAVIDGVLTIAGICGEPTAGAFGQEVTPDQCQACPTRRFS